MVFSHGSPLFPAGLGEHVGPRDVHDDVRAAAKVHQGEYVVVGGLQRGLYIASLYIPRHIIDIYDMYSYLPRSHFLLE